MNKIYKKTQFTRLGKLLIVLLFTQLFIFRSNGQVADLEFNTAQTTSNTFIATHSIKLTNGFSANGVNGPFVFKIVPLPIPNCVPLAATPSATQNYVQTFTPRNYITDAASLPSASVCDVMQTIQYIDGLGRPMQTVQVKGNYDATKDIIQPVYYDDYGRESRKYLPYADGSATSGSYRTDALQQGAGVTNYYTNTPPTGTPQNNYPYAQTSFEPSPLNRVVEQGAPGNAWQIANGHTNKVIYGTNDENSVRLYTADVVTTVGQRTLSSTTFYDPGDLYLSITKNENWVSSMGKNGTTEEYKDKSGRIVLKRMYNAGTALSTYYVYDFAGNLSFVLPPGADPDNGVSADNLDKFCYQYRYDGRNRMVEKKIPGKNGWDYMVYNPADQVVMTQDPVQRGAGSWIVTKYDAFGRPIITGLLDIPEGRLDMQVDVNNNFGNYEDLDYSTDMGYSNNTFPTNITTYSKVTYYDNYDFPGSTNLTNAIVTPAPSQTLVTGTRTYTTDGASSLTSANYYDSEGRLVEGVTQNYLGGTDRLVNTYNFGGDLLTSNRTHMANGQTTTIANTYVYDHMGRKVQSKENINNKGEVVLSRVDYNDVGQPVSKKLHSADGGNTYLNTSTYTYNQRGWLKNQNNPLFNMTLSYEDGPQARYNGDITQQNWGAHNYTYQYDDINRLTAGMSDENFNEVVTYASDGMGNIKSLTRDGGATTTYNYGGEGNRLTSLTGGFAGAFASYVYDDNGNLQYDGLKGVTLNYNYLNLPNTITQNSTGQQMLNTWLADGTKVRKVAGGITRDYVGGIEYNNNVIEFIHTEEGRAVASGNGNYSYEYMIKDHLGNTRVLLSQDGTTRETNDYYPFGLRISRNGETVPSPENRYKYNGKEHQTEFALNQYDYGARFYDPVIGRWGSVDPLAEDSRRWSPYNYVMNNPLLLIDPDGMAPGRFGEGGDPTIDDSQATTEANNEQAKKAEQDQADADGVTKKDEPGKGGLKPGIVPLVHVNGQRSFGAMLITLSGSVPKPLIAADIALQEVPVLDVVLDAVTAGYMLSALTKNSHIKMASKPKGKVSRVTPGEMKKLQQNGFEPHDHKPQQGNTGGKIDFWKDVDGNLFYRAENSLNYEPTYENINSILNN